MKRKKYKKSKRKGMHKIHDSIVKSLEKRLQNSGRYSYIDTHVEYYKHGLHGEIDVLTFCSESMTYHFYEVKCNDTEQNYDKALRQYHRYCDANPHNKVKGIYVTRQKIRRL